MKWLLLLLLPSCAFADGLSVGAGKLLNNANTAHQGLVTDLTYTRGPIQLSFSKVSDTLMGSEMVATAMYRLGRGKTTLSLGAVAAYSVQVQDWWFTSGRQDAWGLHANCVMCGVAAQVEYRATPKVSVQVRYWGTERMIIPSHNGALVVLSYAL
jgi:hypothetical protein